MQASHPLSSPPLADEHRRTSGFGTWRWAGVAGAGLVTAVIVWQFLLLLGVWDPKGGVRVGALTGGEQEIAFIEPATNSDDWERLVSAAKHLERDWPSVCPDQPPLHISLEHAFPRLTADLPEIRLWLGDDEGQALVLRWYKISGEHDTHSWIEGLRQRQRAPLAVMGGGSSGRATRLALNLAAAEGAGWPGSPPILAITNATAENDPRVAGRRIMGIYEGRSFRFAFMNPLMVEAVLRFVGQNPQVWVHKTGDPSVLAASVACATPWSSISLLQASGHFAPYDLHTLHWDDDSYSRDLADAFRQEFGRLGDDGAIFDEGSLPYSIGDFYHPTPPEQAAVSALLTNRSPFPPHSMLVLPATAPRMRRFLGNLRSRAPLDVRNLLVVNGDSLTFHTLYRDRDYAWNIQDLPFSLIIFAHRNPIDRDAGFSWEGEYEPGHSATGTHDLLLYRDILEALVHAGYDHGRLLDSADQVRERLRQTRWGMPSPATAARVGNALDQGWAAAGRPFFDAAGNRSKGTGEYIVWLRPSYSGDRLDLVSTLSVWSAGPEDGTWRLIDAHEVTYNQARPEAGP